MRPRSVKIRLGARERLILSAVFLVRSCSESVGLPREN